MKHTNINLLDTHLADRDLDRVAMNLIAMENATVFCEMRGLSTTYIQEGRDLFDRFAREIDPEFAQQARDHASRLIARSIKYYPVVFTESHVTYLRSLKPPRTGTLDEIAPLFGDNIRPND